MLHCYFISMHLTIPDLAAVLTFSDAGSPACATSLRQWEFDARLEPDTAAIAKREASAMILGDGAGDGEAEADPARLAIA
jgi:hypothetical protein